MPWSFSSDRPIYAQLVERLQTAIVTGQYPPGSRLPSVRELAETAAVNPNTMQRALAELESRGLVCAQRTAGRLVTEDAAQIAALRKQLARAAAERFLREMAELGFQRSEVIPLLQEEELT